MNLSWLVVRNRNRYYNPEEQKRLVEEYNATRGRLKELDTTGTGYADLEGFKKLDEEK